MIVYVTLQYLFVNSCDQRSTKIRLTHTVTCLSRQMATTKRKGIHPVQVENSTNQGASPAPAPDVENSTNEEASPDPANSSKVLKKAEQWMQDAVEGRSLVIATTGKSGVGKSSMINNFLELEGDDACPIGDDAEPTTAEVKIINKEKYGITTTLIDTPGLGDLDTKMKSTLKDLSSRTQQKADILLYCASLHTTSRFNATDIEIIKAFNKAYGSEIWKRTILVLTFANERGNKSEDDYKKLIEGYAGRFYDVLYKAKIRENIQVKSIFSGEVEVGTIPAIPIGEDTIDDRLQCGQNWSDLLLVEILKRSNPKAAIQLLKWKGLLSLESAAAAAELSDSILIGAGAGAAISTVVGAPFGALGIFPALAAGIPIGAIAGGMVWLGKYGIVSKLQQKKREKQYKLTKQQKEGNDENNEGAPAESGNPQETARQDNKAQ